ncbi:MAG: IS3 family transposase [Pauljensenia sp.]
MAQRFGVTSSTMVRAATPTLGITPLAGRCTRSERVHRLRIGCTAHANKPKRGHAHLPTSRQHTTHWNTTRRQVKLKGLTPAEYRDQTLREAA